MPGDIEARLKKCVNALHIIEQHTTTLSKRYVRRTTPVFFSQGFTFNSASPLVELERSIVNNAEECFLTDVSAAVIYNNASQGRSVPLIQTGFGWETGYLAGGGLGTTTFDFVWNFRLASTGAAYRTNRLSEKAINEVGGCFSRSLGYADRASYMRFSAPLVFAPADSVAVSVRPLLTAPASASSVDVYITFSGFRTEEQFESDWTQGS